MQPAATDAGGGGLLRVRLDLAYDGTDFFGWAGQPGRRTVQATLEHALGVVLRIEPPRLTVAGRTDAGVHARGQVCHVDVTHEAWEAVPGRSSRSPGDALVHRLAGVLPADLRVRGATVVPAGFDARFSALWRRYAYRVTDAPGGADPLRRHDTLAWPRPLDRDALAAASAGLLGEHDYAAYCRRREGATTVRTLLQLDWDRDPAGVLVATVRADAFCHSMVRSLVGALLAVGDGRRPPAWPASLLTAGERSGAVTVAPAHGLTLVEVAYPPDADLAARAAATRRRRPSCPRLTASPPADGFGRRLTDSAAD